jgi:hypothetical protein
MARRRRYASSQHCRITGPLYGEADMTLLTAKGKPRSTRFCENGLWSPIMLRWPCSIRGE